MRLRGGKQIINRRTSKSSIRFEKPLFTEIACLGDSINHYPILIECRNNNLGVKMKKKKSTYDWKITFKKFLWVLGEVLVSGFLAYATDNPELLGLIPIAEALRNMLKHM